MKKKQKFWLYCLIMLALLSFYGAFWESMFSRGEASALFSIIGIIFSLSSLVLYISISNSEEVPDSGLIINKEQTPQRNIPKRPGILTMLSDELSNEDLLILRNSAMRDAPLEYCSANKKYRLLSVEYITSTGRIKIYIQKEETYQTIERYYQRNYIKYPVYSAPKTKYVKETYSMHLAGNVLENFRSHSPNDIVSALADRILGSLDIPNLYPSWLVKKWLHFEMEVAENYREGETKRVKNIYESKESRLLEELQEISKPFNKLHKKCSKFIVLIEIINREICELEALKNKSEKTKRRKRKALKLSAKAEQYQIEYREILKKYDVINNKLSNVIAEKEDKLSEIRKEYEQSKRKIDILLQKVVKVSGVQVSGEFFPIKLLSTRKPQKIKGCYVIRNTKNLKCYVGQSEDVLKRLRQHFHGTVPNNTIFAEDYYTTTEKDREDLFEYMILPLPKGTSLNSYEKELIEYYQAYTNGYNRTAGNQ